MHKKFDYFKNQKTNDSKAVDRRVHDLKQGTKIDAFFAVSGFTGADLVDASEVDEFFVSVVDGKIIITTLNGDEITSSRNAVAMKQWILSKEKELAIVRYENKKTKKFIWR